MMQWTIGGWIGVAPKTRTREKVGFGIKRRTSAQTRPGRGSQGTDELYTIRKMMDEMPDYYRRLMRDCRDFINPEDQELEISA